MLSTSEMAYFLTRHFDIFRQSLQAPAKGKKLSVETDGFGDFWFKNLEVGNYSLEIKANGFSAITILDINTEKDVNLGDIPLSK